MGAEEAFAAALADHEGGRFAAAEAGYRAVLAREPGHPQANNNLAVLLRRAQRWEEAAACLRMAVAGWPEDAGVRSNLACTLGDQGRVVEALATMRVALALRPEAPGSWFNAGNLLKSAQNRKGAKAAYRRAIRLDPDMGEALSNLGDCQREDGALTLAVDSYLAAIRVRPDLPQPFVNLGEALKEQGRISEAIGILQKGLEHHPDLALMRSNLLLTLHYSPWIPPEVIARAHRHWSERHARPLFDGAKRFANDRDPDRRLRVGYVSPDFCHHACAHFIEPLLREHDRGTVEVLCYATARRRDDMTLRMEALAAGWRSLADLDDASAAALIERDGVDILVDLAGHTAGGRPLLFARRPAPVQVTWLGYPDTTGMPVVDRRLTDAIADPPGDPDGWHAERLVRLPRGFLAFQPPAGARQRLRHLRLLQQLGQGDAGGGAGVVRPAGAGAHVPAASEEPGLRGHRGAEYRPSRLRPPRRAARADRASGARGVRRRSPADLRPAGRGARPFSLQRHDHDLRVPVDGGSGRHTRRSAPCGAGGLQSAGPVRAGGIGPAG